MTRPLSHVPALLFAAALAGLPTVAPASETFTVESVAITDRKAVFATVESAKAVPARARIGGTLASVAVREGDSVAAGQVLATVGDPKLVLQLQAAEAQAAKAVADFSRAQDLAGRGILPRAQLDAARAAASTAESQLRSQRQLLAEGAVEAPVAGRVLRVPVRAGSVVMPGETVAVVAEEGSILRLRLPERHARALKSGEAIALTQGNEMREGRIRLVYPEIIDGRVVADAEVDGLGGYFVGERVRVLIAAGERQAIRIPERFLMTRYGVDLVRLRMPDVPDLDVPVRRGHAGPEGVEILAGLQPGDVLVQP